MPRLPNGRTSPRLHGSEIASQHPVTTIGVALPARGSGERHGRLLQTGRVSARYTLKGVLMAGVRRVGTLHLVADTLKRWS